jgi:hypothetical protein
LPEFPGHVGSDPHGTEIYPTHAEIVVSNIAGVSKIVRDLIVDVRNPKLTSQGLSRTQDGQRQNAVTVPNLIKNSRLE